MGEGEGGGQETHCPGSCQPPDAHTGTLTTSPSIHVGMGPVDTAMGGLPCDPGVPLGRME